LLLNGSSLQINKPSKRLLLEGLQVLLQIILIFQGGQKYVKDNIFFKFAKDNSEGMYGGNEWAMKVPFLPTYHLRLLETN
jgi:hypothetical protein